MSTQDLVLNIAVNLGRLSRWATVGNNQRMRQFLSETEEYLTQIRSVGVSKRFTPTLEAFERKFEELRVGVKFDQNWAEDALTWANILAHRAKFA